jgi:hypothetical protein
MSVCKLGRPGARVVTLSPLAHGLGRTKNLAIRCDRTLTAPQAPIAAFSGYDPIVATEKRRGRGVSR